jgi:L-rhamnose isomerase
MKNKNTIVLNESILKNIISETVKNCLKEASQEDLDFFNNTENRNAARISIVNYIKKVIADYSLSITDVRYIMNSLNNYIQIKDNF